MSLLSNGEKMDNSINSSSSSSDDSNDDDDKSLIFEDANEDQVVDIDDSHQDDLIPQLLNNNINENENENVQIFHNRKEKKRTILSYSVNNPSMTKHISKNITDSTSKIHFIIILIHLISMSL
jgi:hypothetical protein